MDFNWKRKSRLQEQLKFFGASKTRFISCYAKKPKIKVKLPNNNIKCTDSNRGYLIAQAQGALGSNYGALGGLGMANMMSALGSQLANQQLVSAQAQARQQHAIEQARYHQEVARQQRMLTGL